MDENRAPPGRSSGSGLPRPMSRLPMPRTTALRPSPSIDSLVGYGGKPAEGKSMRLRPAASRERLATGSAFATNSNANVPPTRITDTKPAASISSTAKTLPRPRPISSLPTSSTVPKLPNGGNSNSSTRRPRDALGTLTEQDVPGDKQPSTRLPGLRKRPSSQWISQATFTRNRTPSITNISNGGANDSPSQRSPVDGDSTGEETDRGRGLRPPPSLAERTRETLAQLPSTPSLRSRSRASNSNFFETEPLGSTSRPVSRWGERPGSSRRSESSNPTLARPSLSRPGSSSGPNQDLSSNSPFKSQLLAIEIPPIPSRTSGTLMRKPSRVGLSGSVQPNIASTSSIRTPRARTPNPESPKLLVASPVGPQAVSARALQPRPSVNDVFKKPAMPVTKKATGAPRKDSFASQKSSTTTSAEDTVFSAESATSTPTAESADSPPFKKASSALREQIARAKAAKRAAALPNPAHIEIPQLEGPLKSPVVPTDSSFDFGLADDPFNLKRDASSTSKVLQSRVAVARTSGRLNIAALSLKEIPLEVLNMYNLESIGGGGSWAESVDLTRFVAADNELEMIDESLFPDVDPEGFAEDEGTEGCMFGGLETLDLHGNMLISLPTGLRRLSLLTSLNLSSNRLANNCLETISQITPLRDLKLGGNLLWGTLEPCFNRLTNLEILDLHGNNLQGLPPSFRELNRLRILNLAENSFESLPFDVLSKMPLTELVARKNKLTGVLVEEGVEILPVLQNLDVSSNQLTSITPSNSSLAMPALTQLCVSMNRIQGLPDVSTWPQLITLTADENSINSFPDGFASLQKLKSVDLSSNDIRVVPADIARMDNLTMLRLSGNPLRDKKFVSASIEDIKDALAARLSPPSTAMDEYGHGDGIAEAITSNEVSPLGAAFHGHTEDDRTDTDEFATPPTSAPVSPARPRASSVAMAWQVKPGGVLDRSNTQSSSLHPVACSKLANNTSIRGVQLHHNLFSSLPDSLSFFAETLTTLSLAHNQLVGETYLGCGEGLDFPSLKELNLSSNHITSLAPLVSHLHAPSLEKLDVGVNRIAYLPASCDKEEGGQLLRDAFPNLAVLLIANNHLAELDPDSIRGLRTVDAANNDIAHLNPRIGLLGGLERLDVTGNRFRVPRWNVLERGTEATLRWLRGRVPVAEMAAWKAEKGGSVEEEISDVE